jgi:hypothetical protein
VSPFVEASITLLNFYKNKGDPIGILENTLFPIFDFVSLDLFLFSLLFGFAWHHIVA